MLKSGSNWSLDEHYPSYGGLVLFWSDGPNSPVTGDVFFGGLLDVFVNFCIIFGYYVYISYQSLSKYDINEKKRHYIRNL